MFDLWAGEIQWTDGGVFFCLPDRAIRRRERRLRGDEDACVAHHERMLAWLGRAAEQGALGPEREARRAALRAALRAQLPG